MQVMQYMSGDHRKVILGINTKMISGNFSNLYKLNNTLWNKPREIRKSLELNENENTTNKNL